MGRYWREKRGADCSADCGGVCGEHVRWLARLLCLAALGLGTCDDWSALKASGEESPAEPALAADPALASDSSATAGTLPADSEEEASSGDPFNDLKVQKRPQLPAPQGAKALPEPDRVWVDSKKRIVYVDGYVSLREGLLEMFACPQGTKEHESIVAVQSRAFVVHAALLAVGAKPGHPVRFQPRFAPPTGAKIEIETHWLDDQGKWQKARAQDWIRDANTEKPMEQTFVFAGSALMKDEETGKEYYLAEGGDFICVSNFGSAMIDIPIESSHANDGLLFEAYTDRIPPLGAPVRLVLKPQPDSPADRSPTTAANGAQAGEPLGVSSARKSQ